MHKVIISKTVITSFYTTDHYKKVMNILIELPTWVGDAVMITPSLENIRKKYPNANFSFIGPKSSIELFTDFPRRKELIQIRKNNLEIIRKLLKIYKYEIFISYRSSLRTRVLKYFLSVKLKYQFNKNIYKYGHQVEKYNAFTNKVLGSNYPANHLKLYIKENTHNKIERSIGISPGAAYGSAKRWTLEGFKKVAFELSKDYQIFLLGSKNEIDICNYIENSFKENNSINILNMAGKTNIFELAKLISTLDLFITGDSGPMHIAAAFQVPTISIFGPTQDKNTSQWKNHKSKIIKRHFECQPCMKRTCPLGHHLCMKEITPEEVIIEARKLI